MEGYYSDFEVEEDALSLCDLPLHDQNGDESTEPLKTSTPSGPEEEFFEFCVDPIRGYFPMDAVVFCGKSIPCSKPIITIPTQQQPQNPKNPFFTRSESFKLSSSQRSPGSDAAAATGICRSLWNNPRKQSVVIGLVKYQPEMDMNEMRKRQAKRAPAPMFPVIGGGESGKLAVAGGRSGGKGHWGLMRLLRCRSHLLSALAKAAFGCMPRV